MQRRTSRTVAAMLIALIGLLAFAGCTTGDASEPAPPVTTGDTPDTGLLMFVADGEEHAREGTRSKDGWDIRFEHAYVTLSDITAYQTDPPYDVDENEWGLVYDHMVSLSGEHTVDLANPASDPALVGEIADARAGHYNALSWHMVRAASGPAEGYTMLFVGSAEKDGEVIDFTLRFDREIAYQGGEYVGDVRRGILEAGGEAEAEMTFHFDHFFGRTDKEEGDPMNVAALGFDPLAALATGGVLDVSLVDLEELLDPGNYANLEAILVHFGHVGEGHCIARPLE